MILGWLAWSILIKGMLFMVKDYCSVIILLACVLISPTLNSGGLTVSEEYDTLLSYQQLDLQGELIEALPESDAYFVAGPLNPMLAVTDKSKSVFSTIRVIGDSYSVCLDACDYIIHKSSLQPTIKRVWKGGRKENPEIEGYRGITIDFKWNNDTTSIQFLTTHQNRFLIWYGELLKDNFKAWPEDGIEVYAGAVSAYLARIDSGSYDAVPPRAVDLGLPKEYDFYARPPDYVIDGYQNYKNYLFSYDEIKTEFAHGITAFIPTSETLQWFKDNAPWQVFPNKEAARLQEEYRKFFERGGNARIIQTLTREGFDTLITSEYFFAVGVNGNIRFGREIPREEVRELEEKSGREIPRANHAFLFPGEAVLTAGAFFIDDGKTNKLVKVNAQSGHYFYSNIAPSIREDIAERSDYYLLTLGHFFKALDRLEIPYDKILISKL
jgi:hypothetical protein